MNDTNNTGPFRTLGEMFFSRLQINGNNIWQYIDDTNETTTFAEVLQWSIRIAIRLKKKGIGQDDVISSCTYNHKYTPVPLVASQLIGAISSNFDPLLSHLDTTHLLKLIQPKILFVAEESLEFIENCLQKAQVTTELIVFGNSKKYAQFSEYVEPIQGEKTFEPTKIEDNLDTAVIFFSSGTTGLPKGICLSHRALLRAVGEDVCFHDSPNKKTVILLYTSLYWISAAFNLFKAVLQKQASVICKKFDPEYTWKLIEKYKVTTVFLAPYNAIDFLHNRPDNVDVSSLDYFLTGSCAVPENLMEHLKTALPHTKIIQGYGQTEAAGIITVFNPNDPEEYAMQLRKPKSCGKMTGGLQWKIVDSVTEKPLGVNQEGELRLKHEGYLMNGYYKTDTSSAFDSEGYLKTGDIVYYDEEDCFFVVDRLKEIFKYRGWHILPAVIEDVLMSHPAVKEAAIIGVPHEVDGERPMAVVVLLNGFDESCLKDIENFVNATVSENQKIRAGIRVVDSIPKTTTGKVKRLELKNIVLGTV